MTGLSTLLFTAGLVVMFGLVYAAGLPGWIASLFLLVIGWTTLGFLQWSDPAILAVQALAGALSLWLSLWWTLRHRAWGRRMAKDRAEAAEKQQQISGAVQLLKDKIALQAAEVDRGLKQYELVKKLAEAVSWKEMTPTLERAMKYFFQSESWTLYLADEQGQLQLMHRRGITPDPRVEDLGRRDPYLFTFVAPSGVDEGRTVWALGLPLWRLHERIGLLIVRAPDLSADQHPALLAEAGTLSVQLIFAMAKAKLHRELDRRSRTDGLTGLARRGAFDDRLKEEVARARSFRSTFSILMIDVDHFKRLNDTYGHQVGDEVLKTVAQRIRESVYETDVVARFGGEEFVCLLPRSDPAGLKVKADQIRQRVASQAFIIGLESVTVTISIGIAHFPRDGETGEALMAAADRALYAAKHGGRNCVVEAASVT